MKSYKDLIVFSYYNGQIKARPLSSLKDVWKFIRMFGWMIEDSLYERLGIDYKNLIVVSYYGGQIKARPLSSLKDVRRSIRMFGWMIEDGIAKRVEYVENLKRVFDYKNWIIFSYYDGQIEARPLASFRDLKRSIRMFGWMIYDNAFLGK